MRWGEMLMRRSSFLRQSRLTTGWGLGLGLRELGTTTRGLPIALVIENSAKERRRCFVRRSGPRKS